eukprot:349801-Chlamydomonas_euryale.AAC.57
MHVQQQSAHVQRLSEAGRPLRACAVALQHAPPACQPVCTSLSPNRMHACMHACKLACTHAACHSSTDRTSHAPPRAPAAAVLRHVPPPWLPQPLRGPPPACQLPPAAPRAAATAGAAP